MSLRDYLRPGALRAGLDDLLIAGWNGVKRARELQLAPAERRLLKKNRELHNLYAGQRCWILGNGPSLRELDLRRLSGEHVFVVNRFIHHPDAELLAPQFYVVIDPKFGEGAWGTDFIADVERRLPHTWMFTGLDGDAFLNQHGLLQSHRRFAILVNQFFHFGFTGGVDLTRGIPGADNVTKAALSVAVAMGFSEINLLGIDGDGLLRSENSHFYGQVPRPTEQLELERALAGSAMGMRSWRAIVPWLKRRGVRLVSRNPHSTLTALPYAPLPWEEPR